MKPTKHQTISYEHLRDILLFAIVCVTIACILVFQDVNDRLLSALADDTQTIINLYDDISVYKESIVERDSVIDQLTQEVNELNEKISTLEQTIEDLKGSDPRYGIFGIVKDVCADYNNVIDPHLVMAVIQQESGYDSKATNGTHLGLMQVSTRWHKARAERLGVTDWYDPASNIRMGVDYLVEIQREVKKVYGTNDISLVLMVYRLGYYDASKYYRSGVTHSYATSVLKIRDQLKEANM